LACGYLGVLLLVQQNRALDLTSRLAYETSDWTLYPDAPGAWIKLIKEKLRLQSLGMPQADLDSLTMEASRRFPDHLFFRSGHLDLLLRQGRVEEARIYYRQMEKDLSAQSGWADFAKQSVARGWPK
jgi:hypothetical protein